MNKKIIVSIAALLLIGAGAIYAFGGGAIRFGTPTEEQLDTAPHQTAESVAQKTTEELEQTAASQAEEIEELRSQVEHLSYALAQSEELVTPSSAPDMNIVQVSSPTSAESKPAVAESKSAPAPSAPPAKVQNAGTVFEGYTVTVTNKTTPASYSGGTDWPITTYYFFDAQDNKLGSISVKAYTDIMNIYGKKNQATGGWLPPNGNDWVVWFANEYNAYRNLGTVAVPDTSNTNEDDSDTEFDVDSLTAEAFALVNQERVDAGLNEVDMDSEMMDLAMLRAQELEERYEHIRPDGGRISSDYGYAEINNRRGDTASIAVSSWMGSSGHKEIILTEKYTSAGIGCHMGSDGTVYWCMLFSK